VISSLVDSLKSGLINLSVLQDISVAVHHNTTHLSPVNYAEICSGIFEQLTVLLEKTGGTRILNTPEYDSLLQGLKLLLKAYGVAADDIATTSLGGEFATKDKSSTIKYAQQ
jgi:hypothetical protein